MNEQSRIRLNPVTKEIEIEGSEAFVKTYFHKLQAMMSELAENTAEEPKAKKSRSVKKPAKVAKVKTRNKKKVTHIGAVVGLIQASAKGISTYALKEKTGLTERQIWSIVNRASKEGKIRKVKRGLYGAA